MRILFISANPDWTPRLDLLAELRELKQSLKGKRYELELLPAAQPDDLRDAVERSDKPIDIVHFSGHATEKHGLLFAKAGGGKQALTASQLNEVFANKPVKLAVLNACHTKSTAKGIRIGSSSKVSSADSDEKGLAGFANTVIGTKKKVQDGAAKKLTKVLYSSLAQGNSLKKAYAAATKTIEDTGFENVYMTDRNKEVDAPDFEFAEGEAATDKENEDQWDRYFFERYLDDQIESITDHITWNYRVLIALLSLGVTILAISWGEHLWALRDDLNGVWAVISHAAEDTGTALVTFGMAVLGMAKESLSETPLLDWLTNAGEAIPLLIASLQHRWCVHSNVKLRELKALRELVTNSERLSETLKTRLHKILDQSVRAADVELTVSQEELTPDEQQTVAALTDAGVPNDR